MVKNLWRKIVSIEYLKKNVEKIKKGKNRDEYEKNLSLLGIALVCSGTLAIAGNVFADDNTQQQTPVTATITVDKLPETPDVPKPGPNPDDATNGDNTQVNPSAAKVSIAYYPKAFTGNAKLTNGAGTATVNLNASSTDGNSASPIAHVGVKDQTKEKNNWKLQGSFTTADAQLTGSTIKLNNGTVRMNNGGNLEALANIEVTATSTATLGTTPVNLMSADNTKVQYGVYDYQFDGIQLEIANSAAVSAGAYAGTVNWNLADALTK